MTSCLSISQANLTTLWTFDSAYKLYLLMFMQSQLKCADVARLKHFHYFTSLFEFFTLTESQEPDVGTVNQLLLLSSAPQVFFFSDMFCIFSSPRLGILRCCITNRSLQFNVFGDLKWWSQQSGSCNITYSLSSILYI